jgi:signal transduction histidine kinase
MNIVKKNLRSHPVAGTLLWVLLSFQFLLQPLAATMIAPSPYRVDPHTLHLWHLDEAHTPAANVVPGAKQLLSLHNGALLGVPGAPGFGTCLKTSTNAVPPANIALFHGGILLAAPRLASSGVDNVPPPFPYFGENGAFTMEALVNLDVLPENMLSHAGMIFSMDDDDVDIRRIFHFRLEKSGHITFSPLPGSKSRGGGYARIPSTGPHAIATGVWFHVAVAYDGNAGSADNIRLYWTRLDSQVKEANLIGSGILSANLNGDLGDFAIGNEARQFRGNGESEPFPGCIDEVRISSIARQPNDFLFSNPVANSERNDNIAKQAGVTTLIETIRVNGAPFAEAWKADEMLELPAGQHRLDIGFRHLTGPASGPVKVMYQLAGAEEGWQTAARGMLVICQFLNEQGGIVSQAVFPNSGTSQGWEGTINDSTLLPRREPLVVPHEASQIRIRISSGSEDTTGTFVIDDLTIHPADLNTAMEASLWDNSEFDLGDHLERPTATPTGWARGGSDPRICRVAATSRAPSLSLVDGESESGGEWTRSIPLHPSVKGGDTLIMSWAEAYNIIEGRQHVASYLTVPPGDYVFRVTAITLNGTKAASSSLLNIHIPQPLLQRKWFGPTLAAGAVTLLASIVLMAIRQRNRSKVERLRLQTELERDRTRIARDMHDDLGTVATAITMTASLATRNLKDNPAKAAEHLKTVRGSARRLVTAMDALVWAVDPANDTLDELGIHLTRMVEEVFMHSEIRHRLRIPSTLPRTHLGSGVRHQLALAVKEALHNILQHSGASEAVLALETHKHLLSIEVRDNGCGFHQTSPRGHGLNNMEKRLQAIGGTCLIESRPGEGTTVRFDIPWSLASRQRNEKLPE